MTPSLAYAAWCVAVGLAVAACAYLLGRWRRGTLDLHRDATVIVAGSVGTLMVALAAFAGGVAGAVVIGIASSGAGVWLWRAAIAGSTAFVTPQSRRWGRRAGAFLTLVGGLILLGIPFRYLVTHLVN